MDIPIPTMQYIIRHQARVAPLRSVAEVGWCIVEGWRSTMAQKTGTNAWYDAVSDCVCIPAYMAGMAADIMYQPTLTHELTHAAQRERMGLALYLISKSMMRGKLEAEAVAEEKRAQIVLGVVVLGVDTK